VGQNNSVFSPVPEFSVYEESIRLINVNNIIENRNMPEWLRVFIDGGIEAVEKLEAYVNKFVFIAVNEGNNFTALSKWADKISAAHDFPVMAAKRIENRMILTASRYPDDEYGEFFERMIKNAYSGMYPGTVKEGTHWIKIWYENEITYEYSEKYIFFVLVTIDKSIMQIVIRNMLGRTNAAVTVTGTQSNSINRLRQTFFEGF
jgi:hypothetical protein